MGCGELEAGRCIALVESILIEDLKVLDRSFERCFIDSLVF